MLGIVLSSVSADQATDIESFKAAYSAYQQFLETGQFENAAAEAKTAYELGQRIYGKEHKNTASLAYNYGLTLIDIGENDEAGKVLKETLILYEGIYGKNDIELIPVLMDLGHARAKTFEPDRSKKYYRRALKITQEIYGEESKESGLRSLDIGIALLNVTQSVDAKYFLKDAYTILRNALGDDNPSTGYAAFQLARLEVATRNYADAEGHLLAALKTFEDPERPSTAVEMSTHAWLVSVYEEMDKPELATEHCLAIGRMTPYTEDQEYLPLFRTHPRYPTVAQMKNKEGYVDVVFTVDHEGIVREPRIVDGDSIFEKNALEAVKEWRFAPRFSDGQPVATTDVATRLTFKFAD